MAWSRRNVLAASAAGLAGCASTPDTETPTGTPNAPVPGAGYAYTHLQASGNRVVGRNPTTDGEGRVPGGGGLEGTSPVEVPVDGCPAWLLAFGGESATRWTVVTVDGTARTHRVTDDAAAVVADHGPVSTPPLAALADGTVDLEAFPEDVAAYSHPVPIENGRLYVDDGGDVAIRRGGTTGRLAANAPPDARVVAVGDGRYALYGGRTDRYRHGALGDHVEAASLVVIDAERGARETVVELEPPAVFEGLSPLVADLDGDGAPELVTTVSDAADGARIRAYGTDGSELATGPIHGSGWRHQLCVAPFGPDGRPELAVVRKPHVEWVLEFYRLEGEELPVTATRQGYASHTYGSRNLDGALAGDLNGDDRPEVLVPTTDRTTLAAVRRTDEGTETVLSLSLGGSLATNLAGTVREDGGVAVGAGTDEGVRVWQS